MRVLVTGAGGFVGRVLVRLLSKHGHIITGLDICPDTGETDDWIVHNPKARLQINKLPNNIDTIIHLAQSPAYTKGPKGEPDVFATNVAMLSDLLFYADRIGVSQFVSASSGSVYEPYDNEMREDIFVSPTGYYGASKLAAEILANAYKDRFLVCNFRLFFVYGPKQKNMLIARLIDSVKQQKTLTLPEKGDGLKFVPTYVDDVANCFLEAIENKWQGTLNIASPEAVTFKYLLETIAKATNKDLIIERTGNAPTNPIVPNLSKLAKLIDLEEFHSLENGIYLTVKE